MEKHIYSLELLKRNGTSRHICPGNPGHERAGSEQLNRYKCNGQHIIPMGFYNKAIFRKEGTFRGALLSEDIENIPDSYYSYDILLYDIDLPEGLDLNKYEAKRNAITESLQQQLGENGGEIDKSKIFMFMSVKMNIEILDEFADMQGMHKGVYETVADYMAKMNISADFVLFASTGNHDYLIVSALDFRSPCFKNDFMQLVRFPSRLRRKRKEDTTIAYIDFSTSFFAHCCKLFESFGTGGFNEIIRVNNGLEICCEVIIRCSSLHYRRSAQNLQGELRGKLEADCGGIAGRYTLSVQYVQGWADYFIHYKGPLVGLIWLYSTRALLSDELINFFRATQLSMLDMYTKEAATEASNARLLTGDWSFSEYDQDDDATGSNGYNDVSCILKRLLRLTEVVKPHVPYFSVPTLMNLYCNVKYLLESDSHFATGQKAYEVLTEFLERIEKLTRDGAVNITGRQIGGYLQALSVSLPGANIAGTTQLERVESIDWTSPVFKLVFGLQALLKVIYDALNHPDSNSKLILYITLGKQSEITTESFLERTYAGKRKWLVGLNLPNSAALDPFSSFGIMIHEITFYVSLEADFRRRNEVYIHFVMREVAIMLDKIAKDIYYQHKDKKFRCNKIANMLARIIIYRINAEDANQLRDMDTRELSAKVKALFDVILNEQGYEFTEENRNDESPGYITFKDVNECVVSADEPDRAWGARVAMFIRVEVLPFYLMKAWNMVQPAGDELLSAFKEIFSDILMYDILQTVWISYINSYYKYLVDGKELTKARGDNFYLMRKAGVFIYAACIENEIYGYEKTEEIQHLIYNAIEENKTANDDGKSYRDAIYVFAVENSSILAPIVRYFLKNARERREQMAANPNIKPFGEMMVNDGTKSVSRQEIERLEYVLNEWRRDFGKIGTNARNARNGGGPE